MRAETIRRAITEQSRLETNSSSAPNASQSQALRLGRTDETPQQVLDRILWQSVHGAGSQPPPPGPNAEKGG